MSLTNEQRRDLLVVWLERNGVRVHPGQLGWQKVSCPGNGHPWGDRNPSASVSLKTGYFKCFGCGMEGDAVDLVMQETGLDFQGALANLGVESRNGKPQLKEPETWI